MQFTYFRKQPSVTASRLFSQALQIDGPSGQQKGGSGNPSGALLAPPISPPGITDSSSSSANEDDKEGGRDADNTKDNNFDRNGNPLDSTGDRGHLAVKSDGTLMAEGADTEIGPTPRYAPGTTYNNFSRHLFASSEAEELPNVTAQPWCTTTLQETGRCIGAELEVAMLCMQKRLGKVKKKSYIEIEVGGAWSSDEADEYCFYWSYRTGQRMGVTEKIPAENSTGRKNYCSIWCLGVNASTGLPCIAPVKQEQQTLCHSLFQRPCDVPDALFSTLIAFPPPFLFFPNIP